MAIDPKESLTGADALGKLRELLADFPIATMVTVEPHGAITARPIGVVGDHAAFDGSLWFITDRRSRKVQAINSGATTFLIFEDHDKGAYLHLTGRASVIEDRRRLEELYTPVQRTWFPQGLNDPHITLVRFDADQGEFWDQHNGMLRLLAAFAKSVITGVPGSSGNTGTATLGA
jgi:general stress protein 26